MREVKKIALISRFYIKYGMIENGNEKVGGNMESWKRRLLKIGAFLAPYYQAIEELKIKLKGIRRQYRQEGRHAPIEFITGPCEDAQRVF